MNRWQQAKKTAKKGLTTLAAGSILALGGLNPATAQTTQQASQDCDIHTVQTNIQAGNHIAPLEVHLHSKEGSKRYWLRTPQQGDELTSQLDNAYLGRWHLFEENNLREVTAYQDKVIEILSDQENLRIQVPDSYNAQNITIDDKTGVRFRADQGQFEDEKRKLVPLDDIEVYLTCTDDCSQGISASGKATLFTIKSPYTKADTTAGDEQPPIIDEQPDLSDEQPDPTDQDTTHQEAKGLLDIYAGAGLTGAHTSISQITGGGEFTKSNTRWGPEARIQVRYEAPKAIIRLAGSANQLQKREQASNADFSNYHAQAEVHRKFDNNTLGLNYTFDRSEEHQGADKTTRDEHLVAGSIGRLSGGTHTYLQVGRVFQNNKHATPNVDLSQEMKGWQATLAADHLTKNGILRGGLTYKQVTGEQPSTGELTDRALSLEFDYIRELGDNGWYVNPNVGLTRTNHDTDRWSNTSTQASGAVTLGRRF